MRKNAYIVIKNRPCKVADVSTSKTGKHGHAKCVFVGIDIFTGKKYEDLSPSSHNVDVPHVSRLDYTLLDITDDGFVRCVRCCCGEGGVEGVCGCVGERAVCDKGLCGRQGEGWARGVLRACEGVRPPRGHMSGGERVPRAARCMVKSTVTAGSPFPMAAAIAAAAAA